MMKEEPSARKKITKAILAKSIRIGRATALAIGLAVMVGLTGGFASSALAGTGVGGLFNLGQNNGVNAQSLLFGNSPGAAMLRIVNQGAGEAIRLVVPVGQPPMSVSAGAAKVTNLDSDKLDGKDSSEFVQNSTYSNESAVGPGIGLTDGTHVSSVSCNVGDRMLSGGPTNINSTTILLESFPKDTTTWKVKVQKNGQTDNFSVAVLCADQ